MVISGKFKVKQAPILARAGESLGKGLAESIPQAFKQGMLQEQLKQFAKEAPGMDPIQAYANLVGIPGISPQAIQAFPELIKRQQMAQGIKNFAGQGSEIPTGQISSQGNIPGENIPLEAAQIRPEIARTGQENIPQIETRGALTPEAYPALPWSTERHYQEMADLQEKFPTASFDELNKMAMENQKRYLELPAAIREQMDFEKGVKKEADASFDSKFNLLKEGGNVFANVSGQELNNIKRSMYKYMRQNPDKTVEESSNKFAELTLDLDKTNIQLDKLLGKGFFDKITSEDTTYKKLKSYQPIYSQTNSEEQYLDKLVESGFSRSRASSIAFKNSDDINKYIEKQKGVSYSPQFVHSKNAKKSQKIAMDILPLLRDKDSILAIASDLQQKMADFDPQIFIESLRDDQENLSPRQQREIAEGMSSVIPNWADILWLPRGKL